MAEYRGFFFDRADKVRAAHNIDRDNDGDAIDFALQLNILPLTLATFEVWEHGRLVHRHHNY
jgi:hypothetical protein